MIQKHFNVKLYKEISYHRSQSWTIKCSSQYVCSDSILILKQNKSGIEAPIFNATKKRNLKLPTVKH